MAEYIEREAALLEIEEWADTFCECDYVWPHVIESITKLHAANVRPVVLCRDCEYWKQWDNTTHYLCTYVAGAKFIRNADDFCSRGEKREES